MWILEDLSKEGADEEDKEDGPELISQIMIKNFSVRTNSAKYNSK